MGHNPLFSVVNHVFPRERACSRPETPILPTRFHEEPDLLSEDSVAENICRVRIARAVAENSSGGIVVGSGSRGVGNNTRALLNY